MIVVVEEVVVVVLVVLQQEVEVLLKPTGTFLDSSGSGPVLGKPGGDALDAVDVSQAMRWTCVVNSDSD